MRVGLHSGSVIVGGVGSNLMMKYTAVGDTVNMAYRVEEAAAPGTILVSEAVYRQVKALFECQQVSVLNPKGIARPVIAYQVLVHEQDQGWALPAAGGSHLIRYCSRRTDVTGIDCGSGGLEGAIGPLRHV